jgi:hypothetical protein
MWLDELCTVRLADEHTVRVGAFRRSNATFWLTILLDILYNLCHH